MSSLRLYMSFDLEHDRDLHDRLVQQAREPAAFTIANRSEGGEMTEEWTARARERISHSDEVLVICGEHTDESPRVSTELKIAQEEHKPYVLLWGRRNSMCKKPRSARPDDAMYSWTPNILEHQLALSLRRHQELTVPESMPRTMPAPTSSG